MRDRLILRQELLPDGHLIIVNHALFFADLAIKEDDVTGTRV
jgi:hypothetical protein